MRRKHNSVSGSLVKRVVWPSVVLVAVGGLVSLLPLLAHPTLVAATECVSGCSGVLANGESNSASISSDGRYVAFLSLASSLVAADTNSAADVFVKDRQSGSMQRVSLTADGQQADAECRSPSVSGDGHRVAFVSDATNLCAGDENGEPDVFVRDVATGTTLRISMTQAGGASDGESYQPVLSSDGRIVAFASRATNLVPGDSNAAADVFVRDLATGDLERISVGADGGASNGASEDPAVSADGRFVAFVSTAGNLVNAATGSSPQRAWGIYVRDRVSGTTTMASVSTSGTQGNGHSFSPSISADGALVAFASHASNLVPGDANGHSDVFLRHLVAGTTVLVSSMPSSQFNGDSFYPRLSGEGYRLVFESLATNDDPDAMSRTTGVFLCNLSTGIVSRCSVGVGGSSANGSATHPAISADGRWVTFSAGAWNLVPDDTNGVEDVFVRGPIE